MSNYVEVFGFTEKPFTVSSDARFFYSNMLLEKVYGGVLSHILERHGLIVLSGPPGIGKTSLLNNCRSGAGDNVRFLILPGVSPDFSDILDFLCTELYLNVKSGQQFNQTRLLRRFLEEHSRQDANFVLVLEDADGIDVRVLENLLSLSRSSTSNEYLLQVVLTGAAALSQRMARHAAFRWELKPLHRSEVGPFIEQQLLAVGCRHEQLFSASAIRNIAIYSKGIPGKICALCDSVLFLAAVAKSDVITSALVDEAMQIQGEQPMLTPTSAMLKEQPSVMRNSLADSERRQPQRIAVSPSPEPAAATAPIVPRTKQGVGSRAVVFAGVLLAVFAAGLGWIYWQNSAEQSESLPVTVEAGDTAETAVNASMSEANVAARPQTTGISTAVAPPQSVSAPASPSASFELTVEHIEPLVAQPNTKLESLAIPLLEQKPAIPAPLQSSPEAFIELHDEQNTDD